jgi:UDP-N-acetylmuramyl pentapeptide phosphotransferase/UDP-N-acetylglucosamine-1-phosphate transferase
MPWSGWAAWAAACLSAALTVRWSLRWADERGLIDLETERSLHTGTRPRTGGLGILVGVGVGWLVMPWVGHSIPHWPVLATGLGALAGVSVVDDLRGVSPLSRLLVHAAAGLGVVLVGLQLDAVRLPGVTVELRGAAGPVLTLLFIVWFTNLYNFMDGIDGFAGGMALIGFGTLATLGILRGDAAFAMAAGTVAAAAAGFLLFNFPPARVFMGDAGSVPLGFLVAIFGLWAESAALAPLWVVVLVFSPFFVDATVTLLRRALRGERVWKPHRSHCYQRLVGAGWSHRQTLLTAFALMSGSGVSALLIFDAGIRTQWIALSAWTAIYLTCVVAVERRAGWHAGTIRPVRGANA